MAQVTIIFGEETRQIQAEENALIGDVIARTELPLEQPCAGRGTCGLCKVLNEGGLAPPDPIEHKHLSEGELAVGSRLACRARIHGDARVVLAPTVVYSNKIFKSSSRYKREPDVPLGLAIDLGSTTAAAFLTMLDDGEVCAGAASLNQQAVYGADVISRLAAARRDPADAGRLHRLALSSITQAVDSLKLSDRIRERIQRITIVSNPAMHHLLTQLPVDTLAVMPFQPYSAAAIPNATSLMDGIFPENARVMLPPLIGGFVGSDALACLAYFEFDRAGFPMAAIDLGTNGEVMVTDGKRILTASTAAGPAFEGVNISCGSRAVDGAITRLQVTSSNQIQLNTIGNVAPVGLTGSGLLSAVSQFRRANAVEPNGRISMNSPLVVERENSNTDGHNRVIPLTPDRNLSLTQWDIRELQKAKGAIRAAIDILMSELDLAAGDIEKIILTGSFGGQVDIDAVLELGMIPPVRKEVIQTIANGAGLGAASFLSDEGFQRGINIAEHAEQIDLDMNQNFISRYISSMTLTP